MVGLELAPGESSSELFGEDSLRNLKDGIIRGGRETRQGLAHSEYNKSDQCKQLSAGRCVDWLRLTSWDSAEPAGATRGHEEPFLPVGNWRVINRWIWASWVMQTVIWADSQPGKNVKVETSNGNTG